MRHVDIIVRAVQLGEEAGGVRGEGAGRGDGGGAEVVLEWGARGVVFEEGVERAASRVVELCEGKMNVSNENKRM